MNPFEIALGIQKPWKITDTQLIPSEKNPKARVLDIEDGKGNDTVRAFAESFSLLHGKKDKVKDITSDMCHGYRNAMQEAFPEATLTVDRFHVMKLIGDAVDSVRKRERRCRDKRKRDLLDGTRYIWLKNRENFKNMIYFCMGGFEFPLLPIM